jgi:hypothetical protein
VSDQYEPVREAMAAGTPHELICTGCPWSRPCVNTPEMATVDVDRKIAEAKREALAHGASARQALMVQITAVGMFGGRDQAGAMCPVFIARLRSPEGRQLADAIRTTMRGEPAA